MAAVQRSRGQRFRRGIIVFPTPPSLRRPTAPYTRVCRTCTSTYCIILLLLYTACGTVLLYIILCVYCMYSCTCASYYVDRRLCALYRAVLLATFFLFFMNGHIFRYVFFIFSHHARRHITTLTYNRRILNHSS